MPVAQYTPVGIFLRNFPRYFAGMGHIDQSIPFRIQKIVDPKWSERRSTVLPFWLPFTTLFLRGCFGRSLGLFWHPSGSILVAFGIPLAQFWSLLGSFCDSNSVVFLHPNHSEEIIFLKRIDSSGLDPTRDIQHTQSFQTITFRSNAGRFSPSGARRVSRSAGSVWKI